MSYDLIKSQILNTSVAQVDFLNIPQTYKDLIFTVNAKNNSLNNRSPYTLTINDDTTNSNYQRHEFYDEDSFSGGEFQFDRNIGNISGTGDPYYFAITEMQINGYASNNIRKEIHGIVANPYNATTQYSNWRTGLTWNNTNSIIKISFNTGSNSFVAGSSFCLYGLK